MAQNQTNTLFDDDHSSSSTMISFAGPTGGVGTTLLAANLGIHLAKKGRTVLLADLALRKAGSHLALGIARPELNLGTLLEKNGSSLEGTLTPTPINNLFILAGAPELPQVADMPYLNKQKLLGGIRKLPFDYILVDAGSGTGKDTLDFLLAANYPVIVGQATPVGVEPLYQFIRGFISRLLAEALHKKRFDQIAHLLNPMSPLSGLWDAEELDGKDLRTVEEAIESRHFCFVQTGLDSEKELRSGLQIESLVRNYFLFPLKCIGGLEWDRQAAEARDNLVPIAKSYPMCPFSLATEKLANVFLKQEKEPLEPEGHVVSRPHAELNAYELLNLPWNATPKDIQSAYSKLLEPYLDNSPLTLGLYDKEERQAIRDLLEDAYKTLITTGLRRQLDDELLESGVMSPEERVAEYGELPQETNRPGASLSSQSAPETPDKPPAPRKNHTDELLKEIKIYDGPALKKIREAQGITIAEIVAETNIRAWYIESIERENIDALPGRIYLKGFLKQVAQYLKLGPERVVRDYLGKVDAESPSPGE